MMVNQAQQRLIWGGAVAAGLVALAAVKQLEAPGLNCREELQGFVDRRGRWVSIKSRECE